MRNFLTFSLLFLMTTLALSAQEITYDQIAQGDFSARGVGGLRSMADGEHYTAIRDGSIVKFRYSDGVAVDTLFNVSRVKPKIRVGNYAISTDETLILIPTEVEPIYRHSSKANYFVYDTGTQELFPLSMTGKQQEATFSPNGRMAAFVRENNMWIADLVARTEKQITFDGVKGEVINGIPDWVYEEEYSFSRAFEWSPSSDAIAYYRFDELHVPSYNMNYFDTLLYPKNTTFKYPKAGERNSEVQIKIYRLAGGTHTPVDIGIQTDIYIPRIEWTQNDQVLAIHRLNRLQNRYDLLLVNAMDGLSRSIYTEQSPQYIERIDDQKVTFLPDGKRFILKNETNGWMHLYLYDLTGRKLRQLTNGEWEVLDICGLDTKNSRIFYTSTEASPLETHLYSVDFTGRGKRQLTTQRGTNRISMSRGGKFYINHHSSSTEPTVASLYKSTGQQVRILEDNAALRERLKNYRMPTKEFFTFVNQTGVTLNGYILKPHDFDSTVSYPLFMTQYSGPGSQSVSDSWGVSWEWALLNDGYLVACVDGRGTGKRGEQFRKCTYGNLGALETEDQICGAKYLGSLPYVDSNRIGIYGWSYGGFMALNCILKGNDVFAMAVAIAPVTSWRFYDTIYTELYNGLPQQNPGGYDNNSPLNFAERLKGKLLIAHGTADDNVHVQNTYQMIERLLDHDKKFDWIIYPDKNHGMNNRRDDLMRKVIDYTQANL